MRRCRVFGRGQQDGKRVLLYRAGLEFESSSREVLELLGPKIPLLLEQPDVTGGKAGGTGLGTYSARLLAEAQKGQIRMNTDDATQTTVLTVLLPRQGFGGPGVAS